MTDDIKLLPCPCCGAPARFSLDFENGNGEPAVECSKCSLLSWEVDDWNRRAAVEADRARQAQIIECIAQQWDGCIYEAAAAGDIDIGEAIRTAAARYGQPVSTSARVGMAFYSVEINGVKAIEHQPAAIAEPVASGEWSWERDGERIVYQSYEAAMNQLRARGGTVSPLSAPVAQEPAMRVRVQHRDGEVLDPRIEHTSPAFDNLPAGTIVDLYAAPVATSVAQEPVAPRLHDLADEVIIATHTGNLKLITEKIRALVQAVKAAPVAAQATLLTDAECEEIASRIFAESCVTSVEEAERQDWSLIRAGESNARAKYSAVAAQPSVPDQIERRVYKNSSEYSPYLHARFADRSACRSFEWEGHRWMYRYTSFDDRGDYDLIYRNAAAAGQEK